MEKEEPFYTIGGTATGAATVENSMEVPQKVKNRTILRFSNCTTRYLPKGHKNTDLKGYMHPNVIAALSTIAKLWRKPKCPLTDEWIKKCVCVCVCVCVCMCLCAHIHNGILPSHQKE